MNTETFGWYWKNQPNWNTGERTWKKCKQKKEKAEVKCLDIRKISKLISHQLLKFFW